MSRGTFEIVPLHLKGTLLPMSKKIALVDHCGPDSSFLRMVIGQAAKGASILAADDDRELDSVVDAGVDLILFNRQLEYGFAQRSGAAVIARLKEKRPDLKMMLVSNYADAQAEAVANGALPGFGKREIGTPRVVELIKQALGER
jgi:two-component system, chemotaxis family, chemotaxis protein CheY